MCSQLMISFERGHVISLLLVFLNFLQEAALVAKTGGNTSIQVDTYSSPMINALNYFLLRFNDPDNELNSHASLTLLLGFSLVYNGVIVVSAFSLGIFPKKILFLFTTLSAMIKCYNYSVYLPFLVNSITYVNTSPNG